MGIFQLIQAPIGSHERFLSRIFRIVEILKKSPGCPEDQLRISVKVATYSGLKVATDRSVATRGIKLRKSGHFESSYFRKRVSFMLIQSGAPGLGLPSWVGFGV